MTEQTTLTDRYIDAAMRTVPERQRGDLGAELRASIADSIDARVDAGDDPGAAERGVLTDLGDPDKLAAGYTDRPLHLIGPRYYLDWWRLLTLLLAIVPVCAAFGVALAQTIAGETFGAIVGSVIGVVIQVIVNVAFWTTLVFFIVERTASTRTADPLVRWTPDSLPEPKAAGTGLGDLVATLVLLALAAGAILWDRFVGFVPSDPGLPFLDPALWPWWIGALFVVMVLEALLAIGVYAKGRWDTGLATVDAFLNLTIALAAIWLLVERRLLNPEFFPTIVGANGETVTAVLSAVTGFGIVAIAAWDSFDAFRKARRAP